MQQTEFMFPSGEQCKFKYSLNLQDKWTHLTFDLSELELCSLVRVWLSYGHAGSERAHTWCKATV